MILIREEGKPYIIYSIGEICKFDKIAKGDWTLDKMPYRRIDKHLAIASDDFNPGLIYLKEILEDYHNPIDLDAITYDIMPKLYNKMGELQLRNNCGNVKSLYLIFSDDNIYLINDISIASRVDSSLFFARLRSEAFMEASFNIHKDLPVKDRIRMANLEAMRYGYWFQRYFMMISPYDDKLIRVGE